MTHAQVVILLLLAVLACVYLLYVMWQIRRIHASVAWKFIYLGLTLLTAEAGIALYLAWGQERPPLQLAQSLLALVILAKPVCFAIGFTIWKHDLQALKVRARKGFMAGGDNG